MSLPSALGAGIAKDYQQSPQVETGQDPMDSILPVYNESVPSALLAQQLPPLSKFSGEMSDGDIETFQDWFKQFEMIAGVCGWIAQAKLVNLVTRLWGQVYAFFVPVRFNKRLLVAELHKRFTPVHLQAVQSMIRSKRLGNQWISMHKTCVVYFIKPILMDNKELKRQKGLDRWYL